MDDIPLSHESSNKPQVLREFEYFGGCIRVKISVKNTSSLLIGEAALELESDENILHYDRCEPEYPEKKGKILLGNLDPNTDRTISLYLDPLICAKEGTNVNCRIFYKDAHGRSDMVQMEPLKIKMVCPIFLTEQEINIGRLKELIAELQFRDSKVYMFPKKVELQEILRSCSDVIQLHDVRHIKTFKTTDENTYESWYYGKTKVAKKDLVIKCAIRRDTESIEIFVSGDDPKDITGLLAEIGRHLTKEFETMGNVKPVFNVVVKNSIVKGSDLLSFCDLNGICGGNVVIEDSFVNGTNIASWNKEDKERAQDALRETEQQARQMEKVAHIQEEKKDKPVRIEQGGKSSGGKWFYAVMIIFGVLVLGWYGMQGSNSPQASVNIVPAAAPAVNDMQKTTPSVYTIPVMTAKATPSAAAVVTPSATPTPAVTLSAAVTSTATSEVTPTGNKEIIRITRYKYVNPNQQNLKIKPGDEVIWVNDDSNALTLVSKEGLFEDKLLDNGKQTPSYLFKKTGTYTFDIVVLGVKTFSGTLVVEP